MSMNSDEEEEKKYPTTRLSGKRPISDESLRTSRNSAQTDLTLYRRYQVGNGESTEFGLRHKGKDLAICVRWDYPNTKILIDGEHEYVAFEQCYNTDLVRRPYEFRHAVKNWNLKLGYNN